LGGSAGWNSSVPSAPSLNTPSRIKLWKWTFKLEATPEALNDGHGAAPPLAHTAAAGSAAIEAEHGAHVDGEHGVTRSQPGVQHDVARVEKNGGTPLSPQRGDGGAA